MLINRRAIATLRQVVINALAELLLWPERLQERPANLLEARSGICSIGG